MEVDHINGLRDDNRICNLRLCSHSQNGKRHITIPTAKTPYKGLVWKKNRNKWNAQIRVEGRWLYLGSFIDPKKAAIAYDRAAITHFGQFAGLNFPGDWII